MPAGIVLARLGADVVLTDLAPNLPLLRDNCEANGMRWLSLSTGTMLYPTHKHAIAMAIHGECTGGVWSDTYGITCFQCEFDNTHLVFIIRQIICVRGHLCVLQCLGAIRGGQPQSRSIGGVMTWVHLGVPLMSSLLVVSFAHLHCANKLHDCSMPNA